MSWAEVKKINSNLDEPLNELFKSSGSGELRTAPKGNIEINSAGRIHAMSYVDRALNTSSPQAGVSTSCKLKITLDDEIFDYVSLFATGRGIDSTGGAAIFYMMLTPTHLFSISKSSNNYRTNESPFYGLSYFNESNGNGSRLAKGYDISSVNGINTYRSSTLRTVSYGSVSSYYNSAGVFIPLASNGLVFHKNFKIEITDYVNSNPINPLNGNTMLVYELL